MQDWILLTLTGRIGKLPLKHVLKFTKFVLKVTHVKDVVMYEHRKFQGQTHLFVRDIKLANTVGARNST
jgi:hypothetical protein